jgi:hypothetical protein
MIGPIVQAAGSEGTAALADAKSPQAVRATSGSRKAVRRFIDRFSGYILGRA